MTTIEDMRIAVWAAYHDIEALEDLGFVPIGFPPMNPDDVPDTMSGLRNADEYNRSISFVRFGPSDSVLTAYACAEEITVKINAKEYTMPRACLHCGECADECIGKWIQENVM